MASPAQTKYIQDLAVIKTKEFKELKELLYANQIVEASSEIVANAGTAAEICNALTDLQASKLIESLIATKEPVRANAYGSGRVKKTVAALDEVRAAIDGWGF